MALNVWSLDQQQLDLGNAKPHVPPQWDLLSQKLWSYCQQFTIPKPSKQFQSQQSLRKTDLAPGYFTFLRLVLGWKGVGGMCMGGGVWLKGLQWVNTVWSTLTICCYRALLGCLYEKIIFASFRNKHGMALGSFYKLLAHTLLALFQRMTQSIWCISI